MSFSVDQFMQVKCTFQLTSESESSESIHTNNEQIRLCTSVNMDNNNSCLIVMVCTNETGNNHVLAYYIERRYHNQLHQPTLSQKSFSTSLFRPPSDDSNEPSQLANDESIGRMGAVTFANLAAQSREPSQFSGTRVRVRRAKSKPRIIVKQIYYHDYNEDIVAICLSKNGDKLILVNASSTVYIIPIKNILLNLHAQQLRSSQGRSMYFYDASILNCAQSFPDAVDVAYWESPETQRSTVILAGHNGKLVFVSVDEKKVVCTTNVGEPIKSIKIMRDKHCHTLLITCKGLNQYRQVLELLERTPKPQQDAPNAIQSVISLPPASKKKTGLRQIGTSSDEQAVQAPSWSSRPLPIRPVSSIQSGAASAANALQRVLLPSASRYGSQASIVSNFNDVRERPLSLVGYQEPNLISLVDVLGANSTTAGQIQQQSSQGGTDPRLLRFYSDKQYFYQPQRPSIICKLESLDPNELITELILTERFLALTTDRDRCMVLSRNCCKLRNSVGTQADLSPLIKEITFNHEEKIMLLIRSPAINDQDNIIDSFLLVTTRSIYSIEARHGCRELFINLIDSHLALKRTLFMSKPKSDFEPSYTLGRMIASASENQISYDYDCRRFKQGQETRTAESNLLINSFLQHRDAYERVCHDSLAFSTLFKLDLPSLYEAYADRLLQRGQLELANRFFHMASFDHIKILGKYIRLGAYRETIDYVKGISNDENDFQRVLDEGERIELSKMAFECLLAKTIVERIKLSLFRTKLTHRMRSRLFKHIREEPKSALKQPPDIQQQRQLQPTWSSPALRGLEPFSLCEHSPRGQDAKLSATTIVPNGYDDEETLTSNTGEGDSSAIQRNSMRLMRARSEQTRLECEKSLLDFMKNIMPSSMFEYTIDQLLDFDLIEFIDLITQTDIQILSFIKAVIRYRDEDRLVFRAGRFEPLLSKLRRIEQTDLVKVSIEKEEFLEFLTSPRVTKALVKDIGLTCEFYGYQHTLVQFRKFSYSALRHLETYRQLVCAQNARNENAQTPTVVASSNPDIDDNANDGTDFSMKFKDSTNDKSTDRTNFSQQQKQTLEKIFIEFLNACLDESTEDSCRLWYGYVNFYLNHVGDLNGLQADILRMMDSLGDCRLAISLYRAIHRDETALRASSAKSRSSNPKNVFSNFKISKSSMESPAKSSFLKENVIANTPLETMKQLHSLANLFKNEFLMRLLERTLDLMPQTAVDLSTMGLANMC